VTGVVMSAVRRWLAALAAIAAIGTLTAARQSSAPDESFAATPEHPAIAYGTTPSNDAVVRLARALESGAMRLEHQPDHGYLRSVLRALEINATSQVAVFSKTSLQANLVSPANPRAIYFNDSTAVALPATGFIEIASMDARQGFAFYVLDQAATERPRLARPASCLNCHLAYATLHVPGALVRSVATGPGGATLPFVWNSTTSHRTPTRERWAGWYVTGRSGGVTHLGNTITMAVDGSGADPQPAASAFPSLAERVDASRLLTPHSDIAALLVFDHQMHGLNLMARTSWDVRVALTDAPATAPAVAARVAADLVDYLLFIDEAPLAGPVAGSSGFAAAFTARGPTDRMGRSLRQLALEGRLFRYPCSYLVYSEAFDALPPLALDAVYARLWYVLSGEAREPRYTRRTRVERQAIVEILRETRSGLPPSFQGTVR
jgi:hypothetical protein